MRNVEIKAKVTNYENICKIAEQLSGGPPKIIPQDDTFYNVNNGRLKMRLYSDSTATLVRYDRENKEGPKLSDYDLLHFSDKEIEKVKLLDGILQKCLGLRGKVVKQRKLYMAGQTRIHIDTVEGLGDFMELEVVLNTEQSIEDGKAIARELQLKLDVQDSNLIDCAYIDLLEDKNIFQVQNSQRCDTSLNKRKG